MLEGSDFRFGADEENRRERLSEIHSEAVAKAAASF